MCLKVTECVPFHTSLPPRKSTICILGNRKPVLFITRASHGPIGALDIHLEKLVLF